MVFTELLHCYFYFISTLFLGSLILALFGKNLLAICTQLYLKTVIWVQGKLVEIGGDWHPAEPWSNAASDGDQSAVEEEENDEHQFLFDDEKDEGGENGGTNSAPEGEEENQKKKEKPKNLHQSFWLAMELCEQGIQAIAAEEDLRANFTLAPEYRRYELIPLQKGLKIRNVKFRRRRKSSASTATAISWTKSLPNISAIKNRIRGDERRRKQIRPRLLLLATLAFRIFTLFPVRLALLTLSFSMLAICSVLNLVWPFSALMKTRIAVIYCRIYTMGCGFIIRFRGTENRPKRPGVICANHLSPNDVQVIFSDIPLDRDYLYLVTGQKHKGVIWVLERLVEKICPAIWLERADPESRRRFSIEVVEAAKNAGPVILFPEGYCTNNSTVLQFRRAVFQEDITVYPLAIKQESRFGDSYWSESHFFVYLLRVLTSWAIVYNVHYLEPQRRHPGETSTEFAGRVQRLIAAHVGIRATSYDGGLWYKELERRKAHAEWQRRCTARLKELTTIEGEKIAETAPNGEINNIGNSRETPNEAAMGTNEATERKKDNNIGSSSDEMDLIG